VIDLSTEDVGKIFRFKIRARTYNGDTVDTNALSVALASLPLKPTNPPSSIAAITDTRTLGILIDLFDSTLNGGSEITLYEI